VGNACLLLYFFGVAPFAKSNPIFCWLLIRFFVVLKVGSQMGAREKCVLMKWFAFEVFLFYEQIK